MKIRIPPTGIEIDTENPPPTLKGWGDVVAAVAKPIARAVDAVLGTDLANCGGCKERQDRWNEKFPLTK